MYPCGEINVSEKTVAKSCVAKLSVAKSTYVMAPVPWPSLYCQGSILPVNCSPLKVKFSLAKHCKDSNTAETPLELEGGCIHILSMKKFVS